jgi:hypothetical protein
MLARMTNTITGQTVRGIRRAAIITIIVSLSLTALIGIFALLTGFEEVQGKILLTTLVIAGFSITSLCHLAVVGKALQVVGFVGIVVSGIAMIAAVILIWGSDYIDDLVWKTLGVASVWAVSLAHANLLLLLGQRRNSLIRSGLLITVGLVALVALLITLPIVSDGEIPGYEAQDAYWKFFGVIAILDVLGTIVLPVASRFLRDETAAAPLAPELAPVFAPVLSPELAARLDALAAEPGRSRESVTIDALTEYLRDR